MNPSLRSLLIALTIGAFVALVGIKGCSKAEPWPSTIVLEYSGGEPTGTVVAWAAPVDGQSNVYVHRFAEKDFDRQRELLLARMAKSPCSSLVRRRSSALPS